MNIFRVASQTATPTELRALAQHLVNIIMGSAAVFILEKQTKRATGLYKEAGAKKLRKSRE